LPASAFMLAAPAGGTASLGTNGTSPVDVTSATSSNVTTTGGTINSLPLFTTATNVQSSAITQTGTGTTAKIGINNAAPAATLDVKGPTLIRGNLGVTSTGNATATTGKVSQPIQFTASSFNSSSNAAVNQNLRWQAEPTANNTSSPGATLNFLYGSGTTTPVETGLRIASNGQITFASGQIFPGTGPGTITGVSAGKGLTGGGTTGAVTLNLDVTKVPLLAATNTFTGNQTVNGNLNSTGIITGSSYQIGSDLFGFGLKENLDSFMGFAGNTASTGINVTGVGAFALGSNTTGTDNTGFGANAEFFNVTGSDNTAVGSQAMAYGTENIGNTAVGAMALEGAPGGGTVANTAVGYRALMITAGSASTAIGSEVLTANTSGAGNTGVGSDVLRTNTTGAFNSALGDGSMEFNTIGTNDTAVGTAALTFNTTGDSNVALGNKSLTSNTTGSNNTAVGDHSLSVNDTGSNLTCVGYQCTTAGSNLRNATALGAYSMVSVSDSLVLGSIAGVNGATSTTKVGIGTSAPTAILTIGRGLGHPVSDSWETYSSRRWKTNIQTLPNALAKVERLRGVTYNLKDSGKPEIGVIAEEVGAVVPELVTYEENGKDARGVDYSRLTALLIEAMKQQQKEIQRQSAVVVKQSAAIRQLKSQIRATQDSLEKVRTQINAGKPGTTLAAKQSFTARQSNQENRR
jgi:hypothetical protein